MSTYQIFEIKKLPNVERKFHLLTTHSKVKVASRNQTLPGRCSTTELLQEWLSKGNNMTDYLALCRPDSRPRH